MEMENQLFEKVYVAIGTDLYDGLSTLQWTLRRWSNHKISIVILHAADNICREYVYTLLGKIPASSVSEEKLKVLEKIEVVKSDNILSQYIAFCRKVEAEVVKIEMNEEPLHKRIVDMISSLQITKLVVSFAFMKSLSCKSRTAISGSFHVLQHKPDFCELFVICEGKMVFLREENDERFVQDESGTVVAKLEKNQSIKNWIGKKLTYNYAANINKSPDSPSSSRRNYSTHDQWEKCSQEIEQYVNELLSLHEDGEIDDEPKNVALEENPTELCIPENMDGAERTHVLNCRIQNVQASIQLNKKQANAARQRREKAQWAITICKSRFEELQASINEEAMKKIELSKELDIINEELNELKNEMGQKRSKLNSILELQTELSGKLRLSSSVKMHAEAQLEKAVRTRPDIVQEIEELRKQRDVLQRRIEFCKEKDTIGKASQLNIGFGFNFREFSAVEISAATKDFSESLRLKSGSGRTNSVYRGRIDLTTVAIKIYNPANSQSMEAFTSKVKLLKQIRHPNILAVIGLCHQLNCIVYEYMHNDTLHDALFSKERNRKRNNRPLNWYDRIRIAAEICSAIAFLHNANNPEPIIHGDFLNPSMILLDRHNVAKINILKGALSCDKPNIVKLDITAFGKLVLQLTGKNSVPEMDIIDVAVGDYLDCLAGEWPLDLVTELCSVAIRCLLEESIPTMPMREINAVKKRADEIVANGEFPRHTEEVVDLSNVPSAFLCPIYQDVMQNPHLAADGFSYELEAIDEWLRTGHDTSPMTNLKLKHKLLTPNHTLRSLIQDWQNKRSATQT